MAVAVARTPPRRRARVRRLFGHDPIGYAFLAPYLIFLAALFAYPLVVARLHLVLRLLLRRAGSHRRPSVRRA